MDNKAQTGQRGEALAMDYLRSNGYMICARNWRQGRYEIDIVAQRYGITHIVEVKTRGTGSLLSPEQTITPTKAAALRKAAAAYIAQNRVLGEVEFDLVAIDILPDDSYNIRFIPNCIEFGW
jgi:putative endonuclease